MAKSLEMKSKSQISDKDKIRNFQNKIYLKAKQDKSYRFYILYDKIYIKRYLEESYKRVKSNKGKPGIDNKTFADIEKYGLEKYLDEISDELIKEEYKPSAVLRVNIPKANGKLRPLGIPTIKDRIVQMSCKMVIEPIFEADFEETSFGFRPNRSAKDAIKKIKNNLKNDYTEVLDADLSAYFDTIPHDKLMKVIAQRISDGRILHLIKLWLKAPIYEDKVYKGGKKNKVGVPQGGIISPLLSNIYLNLLERIVNKIGSIFNKQRVKIVRYADDFVLMGQYISKKVIAKVKHILDRMGLKLNKEKTKIVDSKKEAFEFLGFTFRYDKGTIYKGKYFNIFPSDKSFKSIKLNIKELLIKGGSLSPQLLTFKLNQKLRGWMNYFKIDKVSYPKMIFRKLSFYLMERLQRYYYRKSQRISWFYRKGALKILINKYGLLNPNTY